MKLLKIAHPVRPNGALPVKPLKIGGQPTLLGGLPLGKTCRPLAWLVLLLAAAWAPVGPLAAQWGPGPAPYAGQASRVTVTDPTTAETWAADLYRPMLPGTSTPAPGNWPMLAFGHGFQINASAYAQWLTDLAAHGYLVLAPDVQNGFSPNHQRFAEQLLASLAWLQTQADANPAEYPGHNGPTHWGTLGHSMGGGAALAAAGLDARVTAVVGLAPATTNTTPTPAQALANQQPLALLLSGDDDRVTPQAEHVQPVFQAASGATAWLSVASFGHCGYTDGQTACDLGATLVGENPTMPRADQQALALRHTLAALRWAYNADSGALAALCGHNLAQAAITTVRTHALACGTPTHRPAPATTAWQPTGQPGQWRLPSQPTAKPWVADAQGRILAVPTHWQPTGWVVSLQALPAGIYLLGRADGAAGKRVWWAGQR